MENRTQDGNGAAARLTAIRLTPKDDRAIRRIIRRGFAANQSDAIRFALQRAARYVEDHAA